MLHEIIHGLLSEVQALSKQGVGLFIVGQPLCLFVIPDAPDLLKAALWTYHWTQLPVAEDFQFFRSLQPGGQGGWQMRGLFSGLQYKVKLSDLNGVWNHDLGPVLHYNQLS